jgi:iron complex transport system substrate-binding protein
MKARSLLLLVLSILASASVAAAPAAPTRYPLTVVDDTGAAITLNAAPRSIVSLTLATDEILLSLVDPARLIGVTTYATDPAISNVAGRLAAGPAGLTMNVETVIALRPDLVIVANWSDAAAVKQLRDAKLPVYLMASGLTVASIEEKIQRLGLMTDEAARAADMVARIEARLAAVAQKTSRVPKEQRLRVMDYASWGSSQGKGSSWDEIINRAGLVNAVGDKAPDQWGQVPLSRESILAIEPDLLVLPGWVDGDPKGATTFFTDITKDPGLRTLKAVRNKKVLIMPENLKSTTSQYIVDAVEWLARTAYPALFP